MKRSIFLLIAVLMLGLAATAGAQTSSGTLGASATVDGSISLTLATATGGVTLGGTGTNAATLGFGNVSAYGTIADPNVTRSVVAGTSFTVSTPVSVVVQGANVTLASGFSLTAQLAAADSTNTWKVGGTTISDASATTIYGTGTPPAGAYGSSGNSTAISVTVPFTASTGAVSKTINFVATAN